MTFAHPAFLWGLLLLGYPIWLHLRARRKAKVLNFPAAVIVSAGARPRRRSILELYLLLASRLLLILCASLYLAAPAASRAGPQEVSSRLAAVALLVDDSASMARGERPPLELAREAGKALLGSLLPGSEGALYTSSGQSLPFTTDLEALARKLSALQVSLRQKELARAAREALAELSSRELHQRELWLFSDWEIPPPGELALRLAGTHLYLVRLGRQGNDNCGIKLLEFAAPGAPGARVFAGAEAALRCWVRNFSPQSARRELRIFPRGEKGELQELALAAGEERQVSFRLTLASPGLLTGYCELSPADSFPLDDRRYWGLSVGEKQKVLLLSARTSLESASEAYYLSRALAPGGFELQESSTAAVPDMERFSALILAGLPEDRVLWKRLSAYVERGGSLLLLATGENFRAEENILPAPAVGWEEGDYRLLLSPPAERHPLLDNLRGLPGFSAVRFSRIARLGTARPGAVILGSFNPSHQGAQPGELASALLERELGLGRVLLFASGVAPGASELFRRAEFLPFLYECLFYLAGPARASWSAPWEAAPGEELKLPERPGFYFLLGGEELHGQKARTERLSGSSCTAPERLGVYHLARRSGERLTTRALSVNLPAGESGAPMLSPQVLQGLFTGGEVTFLDAKDLSPAKSPSSPPSPPGGEGKVRVRGDAVLLFLAVLSLLAELALRRA